MSDKLCILLLDDDVGHLKMLSGVLVEHGYSVLPCANVEQAMRSLEDNPDFAIVDLFLQGDAGAEDSNGFIRDALIPHGIPYGRMSSAPSLIPESFAGAWVLHKRNFWKNPSSVLVLLQKCFA